MPKCSVIGCGGRRGEKSHHVTLHRLPVNESKRRAWLEIIRSENINTTRKHVYVCSLHFDNSCFNRTMNIVKLRDDALPSQTLLPPVRPIVTSAYSTQNPVTLPLPGSENEPGASTAFGLTSQHGVPEIPIHASQIIAVAGTSASGIFTERDQNVVAVIRASNHEHEFGNIQQYISYSGSTQNVPTLPLPGSENEPGASTAFGLTSQHGVPEILIHARRIIKKLQDKCRIQTKKIKRLNEKVRRQGKKITHFATIIKDLKQRNLLNLETAVLLEQCAGPQDFLKRQISKSEGLPLNEKAIFRRNKKIRNNSAFLLP